MENISLILIIFVIGLVVGRLLVRGNRGRYNDYYYDSYYPPPTPYHSYRYRHSGGGILLFIIILISIFALILLFEDRDIESKAPSLPAKYGTVTASKKQTGKTLRTCYLEIGRYPTWESANEARRRLEVTYQQNLDLINRQPPASGCLLVIGPFRGPEAAQAHRARYGLNAEVVYFD